MSKVYGNWVVIILLLGCAAAQALPAVVERCWGGDGPHPLIDMGSLAPKVRSVRTRGSVKEFVVWEKKNAVVFRNDSNQVFVNYLASGSLQFQGQSNLPLAKLASAQESGLVAHGLGWVWDWITGKWKPFGPIGSVFSHLYWQGETLYTMADPLVSTNRGYEFYRYGEGDTGKKPFCSLKSVALGGSESYGLVHGSEYPNVYLHSTRTLARNYSVLTIAQVDLQRCEVVREFDYSAYPLKASVKDVYRYEAEDTVGVWLDSPNENLLWDTGGALCKYYDVPADSLVPLQSRSPLLAVWAKQDGLSLLSIKGERAHRAKLVNVLPVEELAMTDFWLTSDGTKLYFSPSFHQGEERPILEMKF